MVVDAVATDRGTIMSQSDFNSQMASADERYRALSCALQDGDKSPYVAVCTKQRLEGVLSADDYVKQLAIFDELYGKIKI
jgi:hypothetical protein